MTKSSLRIANYLSNGAMLQRHISSLLYPQFAGLCCAPQAAVNPA